MIIGLSGQAGSGKDTTADFLVKNHGFVKIALADPIKRAAMEWWDFTEEQLWGPSELRNKPDTRYPIWSKEKECYIGFLTPRQALQQIGTEVARAIDPDVWVRIAMRTAKQLLQPPHEGQPGNWRRYRWEYHRTKGLFESAAVSQRHGGVVISDCRFKNEFNAIKKEGKLVRINRDQAGLDGTQAQHASETQQREVSDGFFDFIIENNGTLEDLREETKRLVL